MQKILSFMLAGLFTMNVCQAQFSASGGTNGKPYIVDPAVSSGLDKVFVFNGMDNARLSYATANPAEWTWYRYEQDPNAAVAVSSETTPTETVLSDVRANSGYLVESAQGARHYIYVVGYTPVRYNEIRFVTDGDICNTLTLAVFSDAPEMDYYTVQGYKTKLSRQHTLTWNTLEWDGTKKAYETKPRTSTAVNLAYWSVDAPLKDTRFVVRGDQYAEFFGNATSFESGPYKAVAVKTNALAVVQPREAKNELDRVSESGDLTGSAPLDIQFFSNASDAVEYKEWYIYDTPGVTDSYKRRTDTDITFSFLQSGTASVKLFVSNGTCKDSASFSPQVLVSFIDCPNFFTPRSSPGENDEFRVAYKSLVSFRGVIVNRWGNVIFEWSDPALGWNGTYKGKAVSPGVYFYVIEAKGSDGVVYKKKGDINLLE